MPLCPFQPICFVMACTRHDVIELILIVCFYFQNMALNRAQLLVHNDEALARFYADHRIPDNVIIEKLALMDDVEWVEGEGNRMPVRTWFIHQSGLRFPMSKLLKTVMSLCRITFMQVSVNFI